MSVIITSKVYVFFLSGSHIDLKRSVGTCMKAYSEAEPFVRRIFECLVKSEFIPKEEFEM
jgi:hypothetical protein